MKTKVTAFLLCVMMILGGCTEKEAKRQPYEGNLEKIKTEIEKTKIDIRLPQIKEQKRCRATLYEGEMELNAEEAKLSGNMNITIVNETEKAINELCIRNYAASILEMKDKGKSRIDSIINTHTKEKYSMEVKEDASVIYVDLGSPLNPDGRMTISVQFHTDIPKQDYRFGYHDDEGKKSFLLTYCFPVLAMYEEGSWLEYPYISHAESNYHTPADYKMNFKLPDGYTMAATGDEIIKDNVASVTAKNIRDFACVVSNYMKVDSSQAHNTEVNLYSLDYKNLEEYNEMSLLAGKDSIMMMESLVGEYPYKEIDVVQCFYSSAMEYPGLVLIGYPDVDSPENIEKYADYSHTCSQIAHEVAHQWFYAVIGSNCYEEAWLDEGFSEYFEDVVYPLSGCESVKEAALHGNIYSDWGYETEEDMDEFMDITAQQRLQKQKINLSYEDYEKEEYSQYVYDGGASLLHELRKEMGDGLFFNMLQAYYKMGCMKEVTTKDFVALISEFDDSEKLNTILKKYINY